MEKILKINNTTGTGVFGAIKEYFNLELNDKIFLFGREDYLIIKKIEKPPLSERFKNLSLKTEKRFKKENISKEIINEAIEWSRKN